ncbi:hypothetical protein OSG_eHP14_00215 [environmental Halophage eHP-14]|nr:hypothetical protein OSG_eHP14_00215 [environmental Halophage eHP-14]
MADGYCERQDVLDVLEEDNLSGAYDQRPEIIDAAITSLTEHIRTETNRHWYETGGTLTPSSAVSATNMRYDVPSSPHAQDRQLFRADAEKYPVSTHGPYVRIRLDHADITTLTSLEVRDAAGDVNDWTTDSDKVQGRGEDYYTATPTDAGLAGRTALYIHEGSLPAAVDYEGMVTAGYEYGTDSIPDTVTRMTALLAATQLVTNDEFVSAVPDNGQLANVETKADRWEATAEMLLDNYRTGAVA